jgi:hypothetical protein
MHKAQKQPRQDFFNVQSGAEGPQQSVAGEHEHQHHPAETRSKMVDKKPMLQNDTNNNP